MNLSQVLIEHKNAVRSRTVAILNKVPEDKLNWRPVEGTLTVGQLIHHIGQADMAWTKVLSRAWSFEEFLNIRWGMDLPEVIGEVDNLTEEIEALEITHQECLKWIAAQSDEELEQLYEGGGWKVTAREIVLGLCEHEGHHRGQLVTYLRLLEVKDPRPWGF